MAEFFEILALSSLPAEESMARKISIRRAWVAAKAIVKEPSKKREERGGKRSRTGRIRMTRPTQAYAVA